MSAKKIIVFKLPEGAKIIKTTKGVRPEIVALVPAYPTIPESPVAWINTYDCDTKKKFESDPGLPIDGKGIRMAPNGKIKKEIH